MPRHLSTLNTRSRISHRRDDSLDLENPSAARISKLSQRQARNWRKLAAFAVGATLLIVALLGTVMTSSQHRRLGFELDDKLNQYEGVTVKLLGGDHCGAVCGAVVHKTDGRTMIMLDETRFALKEINNGFESRFRNDRAFINSQTQEEGLRYTADRYMFYPDDKGWYVEETDGVKFLMERDPADGREMEEATYLDDLKNVVTYGIEQLELWKLLSDTYHHNGVAELVVEGAQTQKIYPRCPNLLCDVDRSEKCTEEGVCKACKVSTDLFYTCGCIVKMRLCEACYQTETIDHDVNGTYVPLYPGSLTYRLKRDEDTRLVFTFSKDPDRRLEDTPGSAKFCTSGFKRRYKRFSYETRGLPISAETSVVHWVAGTDSGTRYRGTTYAGRAAIVPSREITFKVRREQPV